MKKLILLVSLTFTIFTSDAYSQAQSFYSIGDGNWTNGSLWSSTPGGTAANDTPAKGDDVHIDGNSITLDIDLSQNPGIELFITNGGSLTSATTQGILIATGGDFQITDGTVDVNTVDLKTGAIVTVGAAGTLSTDTWVANSATITVDGVMNVGTYLDNTGTIEGNGTITAQSYLGSGSVFGISPTSTIPAGTTVGGWTWASATNTDWSDISNWSAGSAPTNTSNVVIMSGATQPIISSAAECNKLTINTGASLDINETSSLTINGDLENNGTLTLNSSSSGTASLITNAAVTGNVVIERFVTGGEWNMITPVTTGITGQTFFDVSANNSWLVFFDESTGIHGGADGTGWEYVVDLATSIEVGKGYNYWPEVNETVSYTGNIQTTDYSPTINYSGADYGYNLIGNPFTSALTFDASWSLSNIQSTIWVYNGSTYSTYTTASNYKVPVGQGFFVRATAGSPSLTLPIANRVHDNTGFEKSNSSNSLYTNYVVISVTDGVYEDNIQISFGSNGSINFEDGWDATKMFGADFAPQLYMIEDNLELAFNHLAEIENQDSKYVNLYFSCGVEGPQTLNFDLSNYSYSEIILEDKETNTFQDLLQNQSYTFDANFSDDEDRFVIHFGNKLTDIKSNQDISPLYIYANDKTVFIKNSESEGQVIIEIYDLLGRKLLNEISHNNLTSYSLNISNSFVVVKASSKNGTKLEKVFIK